MGKDTSQVSDDLESAYYSLGWNVQAAQNPPKSSEELETAYRLPDLATPSVAQDLKQKGFEFLKKYWPKLIGQACIWWSHCLLPFLSLTSLYQVFLLR